MRERSLRGEQTRSRIIRAAVDLFHQKGARATSQDESIKASRTEPSPTSGAIRSSPCGDVKTQ